MKENQMLSEAAKAHRDAEAKDLDDNERVAYKDAFNEAYEFARKEIWEIVKRDWQPRNKPMFATPEEYFATFNQPQPEGE